MGTILIVDDDAVNLRLLQTVLTNQGHSVVTASSGQRALELFTHPGKFQAVMSDYMMPEMSGTDLATRLRKVDPAVKIVIISAYDLEEIRTKLGDTAVSAVISKPYSLGTIRSALGLIGLKPVL